MTQSSGLTSLSCLEVMSTETTLVENFDLASGKGIIPPGLGDLPLLRSQ